MLLDARPNENISKQKKVCDRRTFTEAIENTTNRKLCWVFS